MLKCCRSPGSLGRVRSRAVRHPSERSGLFGGGRGADILGFAVHVGGVGVGVGVCIGLGLNVLGLERLGVGGCGGRGRGGGSAGFHCTNRSGFGACGGCGVAHGDVLGGGGR